MATTEEILDLYEKKSQKAAVVAMWAGMHFDFIAKHPSGGYLEQLKKASDEYSVLDRQLIAIHADESIDQSQFAGDHCGFLAAQCEARQRVGIEPTDEQEQALIDRDERMNAIIERNENTEYLEYR